ncbi:oxidoreductase [Paractinoplanes deccanensis]|uniref:Oxidoreductase n=1 Tax=Paractinoplanes deccanensis TaxID=113561 RepID=A0ABQ3XZ57_9ACTN|nr:FAD-dependent monooxygenase [Actinoplanes deccanensis]GID73028.1 oxidoreductase [Actinoplanes deccanensis]
MAVLVSGASIAGLSVAQQLIARGHQVTVVERAPALRTAGSPIDVRGAALRVAERMGILGDIQRNRVMNSGRALFTTFVDAAGAPVAALPNAEAADSEDDIEIARDRLVAILHEAIGDRAEFRFGDAVAGVEQDPGGVNVTFAGGGERRFDLVVGADGIHSTVRRAVFGPERLFRRHLDVYFAIVDLPLGCGVHGESITYNAPGRMVGVSDFGDRTLGFLAFRSPERPYDYHSLGEQRRLLEDAFAGERGWGCELVLGAVRSASDLYFDSVSQVRMPSWSSGRVVLAGDAAHAAALFSGRGTSLAMIGAALLGEALGAATGGYATAFADYERRLRPHVTRAQEGVTYARDLLVPATAAELAARNSRFPLLAA